MRPSTLALTTAALLASVLAVGEITHWRSSRRRLGSPPATGGDEAIVILGYANRTDRANLINRYRARAGLRSIDPGARRSVLVMCGGAVAGDIPEAELLESYAREQLGYRGEVRLDRESRSTWENIQNAIPLIEDAQVIKIVSNSLHAEKARAHLWTLRPDLARRLARGADHRLGEITYAKPYAALRGLWSLREGRR